MPSSGQVWGKENPARARKVARRAKQATQEKVTVSKAKGNFSCFEGECRNCESMDASQLTAGTSSRSLKAKAKGKRNPKSQKCVRVRTANTSKKHGHLHLRHSYRVRLK